ncbi:MAG: SUMF1/EgtB/PvdO family nonheme iron enzyme [Desulfobacterales bacterium]|nr:SUMF1/EgtB/PvdO family nonheme iron enzyme [Desulfobacterales bacterium]
MHENGKDNDFDPSKAANILHLSDLHFGADKESDPGADAEKWYGRLVDDLCKELGCERLQAIILSGDIGNFSESEEYEAAEVFINKLCKKFSLGPSQLSIVPGNHDLNWKLSKNSYRFLYEENHDEALKEGHFIRVNEDLIGLRDDNAYRKRFEHFSRFHETITGTSYPLDPNEQAIFSHLSELNLLIVGFNSSWETDHHFKTRISINPDAFESALDQIREREEYKNSIKFAVWHHPLSSPGDDRLKDHGFMQRLAQAEFCICLHGHIHKSDAGLYRYDMAADGRRIHVIGAGTFGAPVKDWTPGYPLQYNLLRLSENSLRVESRCRTEINGTWGPDHLWRQGQGKPNLPYYDISLARIDAQKPKPPPPPDFDLENQIRDYCKKAEGLHEKLPLFGFKTRLKVPIDIADIYVPLRAMIDLRATGHSYFADAEDAENCLRKQGVDREISVPDAFREAEKMKPPRRGIVILGDPGSGKTTHMKRILLWCLRGELSQIGLPEDMIPVFLPLRELKDVNSGLDAFIQGQLAHPLLDTPKDFGKRLLDRGSLLFLLDGLDEVADQNLRSKVSRWIETALKVHRNCRFVVTCRFAGYTEQARLDADFLEMHVRPLNENQAETFIRNWYRIVETGLISDPVQAKALALEKADHLIDRLRKPEFRARRIFEMTRNPLLLTNICLVHQSRNNLPQTRALLYDECIDVLLEKWRGAIGFQSRIKTQGGRLVLQPAALWMHQEENRRRASAAELSPIIEPALKAVGWQHGSASDFLELIRDESGLLTGWSGDQYGFMHLGFQEYLAAREIQNRAFRDRKILRELAKRFGESWWQEVTLLLLALDNPCLFAEFMEEVVKLSAFADYTEFMAMCLEESSERTVEPFMELLKAEPGENEEFWVRQLAALRIVERMDKTTLESMASKLRMHPYSKIRKWFETRNIETGQEVIQATQGGYELVFVPGGRFLMGSPAMEQGRYDWEGPQHEVTVPDFYIGRYPVTNEEYGRFIQATSYQEPEYWGDRRYNQPRQPVVGVSWHDAKAFAEWAGLQLPSEAQWEYACRAGTTTPYYSGNSETDLERAGWYYRNSGDKLHPVGEKEPNNFGLYDMHGNVWEWCEDHWHSNYKDAPIDGSAWVDRNEGGNRVLRGGSWGYGAGYCRTASRVRRGPDLRGNDYGFRLVRLPGHRARWMPAC